MSVTRNSIPNPASCADHSGSTRKGRTREGRTRKTIIFFCADRLDSNVYIYIPKEILDWQLRCGGWRIIGGKVSANLRIFHIFATSFSTQIYTSSRVLSAGTSTHEVPTTKIVQVIRFHTAIKFLEKTDIIPENTCFSAKWKIQFTFPYISFTF